MGSVGVDIMVCIYRTGSRQVAVRYISLFLRCEIAEVIVKMLVFRFVMRLTRHHAGTISVC